MAEISDLRLQIQDLQAILDSNKAELEDALANYDQMKAWKMEQQDIFHQYERDKKTIKEENRRLNDDVSSLIETVEHLKYVKIMI